MGIREELESKKTTFPEGKIITLDGKLLDCYPVEEEDVKVVDDSMKLDTTGRYLIIGRRASPDPPPPKELQEQHDLFVNNAFYLLAHRERILSDSRMFLCPVEVRNGLMYTGTSGFTRPTLGVYLEWWAIAPETMMMDGEGRKQLLYYFGGSPLNGSNRSSVVYETGERKVISLSEFSTHWGSFLQINRRYNEAKYRYQACSLQEVLDILRKEDDGNKDYNQVVDIQFMAHEIRRLKREYERLSERCNKGWEKYHDLLCSCHEEEIQAFYAEYKELESKSNEEIGQLREQKKELKAALKRGEMDNIAYQRKLTPIKKKIGDIEYGLFHFRFQRTREVFPNEDITFGLIEWYIHKKENQS